jgi:predicted permease
MWQDFRYAVRTLIQGRAWSLMVIVSLALGIGANTALFSATNGLLLRTVNAHDPEALVRFRHVGRNRMANNISEYGFIQRGEGEFVGSTFSFPLFQELKKANQTLTDLAAGAPLGSVNVVVDGSAEIATAFIATANYETMLGVRPLLGRTLVADDDRPGAAPAITISEQFWGRRFGRSPETIGKAVTVNNAPVTIVGITPSTFVGIQRAVSEVPDVILPLALDRQITPPGPVYTGGPEGSRLDQPTYWWLQVFGRLKPGGTASQVEGNLGGVFQQAAREGMASFLSSLPETERNRPANRARDEVSHLSVSSAARGLYDNDESTLRGVAIISTVVALILLLVCANVANLLLSRAAARQKEISVRLSIGATRLRLVRQLLTESVLLATLGGALGVLVAYWGRQLLPGTTGQAPLDWRVMLFAAAVALTTGILFGIAPAWRVTGAGAGEALKETSRAVIGTRTLLSRVLLVVQVAISLVLLVGAGLFLRTVANLRQVDVGFNPNNLVLFRVNPQLNRYDAPRSTALYAQMQERLSALPGVRAVTFTNPAILAGGINTTGIFIQGRLYDAAASDPARRDNNIGRIRIAPGFFATMEMQLLRGRDLDDRDNVLTAPKVAVINEAAVRKYFPNEDPLGKRFGNNPDTTGQIEIVGVVRDAKYNALRDAPQPTMYVPFANYPVGPMTVVVRTAGEPASAMSAIRESVRQVDPNLPLMDMSTQSDQIERRFQQERVFAQAYTLFGVLALLVAAIGLFGLMSYSVTRRTTEIGIRMALGARQQTVMQMVLRESLVLVVVGVVIGLTGAVSAGPLVASLLYGLDPGDAPTLGVAVALMLVVSGIAGYLPARRAARLDPMIALRHD